MSIKKYIIVLFVGFSGVCFANDSTFTFQEYLGLVKKHHPITYQANLILKKGKAQKLKGRGGFDPRLESDAGAKQFKGEAYYNTMDAALKLPSWFGLSFQAGFQQTGGGRLNPQLSTPAAGLAFAGVNWEVGKGLLMDKRRAELKKGKIYQKLSVQEQRMLLNDLILNASEAYWNWYSAFFKVEVGENALENSHARFKVIKRSAILGDKSMMDTLEAWIQVQAREIRLEKLKLNLVKQTNKLNLYLWVDGNVPMVLRNNVAPDDDNNVSIVEAIQADSLVKQHPKLLAQNQYLELNKYDIKLAREALRPKISLKYNPLFTVDNIDVAGLYQTDNLQYGIKFSYPIPSRKAIGELRIQKAERDGLGFKIKQTEFKLLQASKNALASYDTYVLQEKQYKSLVENYGALLKAEEVLFFGGESSFFMINSREQKYLQSQEKRIEIIKLKNKAIAKYNHALCVY